MITVSVTLTNNTVSIAHYHREEKDRRYPDQPLWQGAFRNAVRYQPAIAFYLSNLQTHEILSEMIFLKKFSGWKQVKIVDVDNNLITIEEPKEEVFKGPPSDEDDMFDAIWSQPLFQCMDLLGRGEQEEQCVCGSWNCESQDIHLKQEMGISL